MISHVEMMFDGGEGDIEREGIEVATVGNALGKGGFPCFAVYLGRLGADCRHISRTGTTSIHCVCGH